jgi:anti-sigma regulatory factor (Ser/Thr protein kinase)
VDVELPAEASSAAAARAAVRSLLATVPGPGAEPQAVDRVLLLTSEVVTNAILHARTPLRVTAELVDGQVLVRVYDSLQMPPRRRAYRADAGTGRGIQLVEALSDTWGVDQTSAGKSVWFAVALSGASSTAQYG